MSIQHTVMKWVYRFSVFSFCLLILYTHTVCCILRREKKSQNFISKNWIHDFVRLTTVMPPFLRHGFIIDHKTALRRKNSHFIIKPVHSIDSRFKNRIKSKNGTREWNNLFRTRFHGHWVSILFRSFSVLIFDRKSERIINVLFRIVLEAKVSTCTVSKVVDVAVLNQGKC